MTYTDGQRIERHQVEPWVAEASNAPFFKARVVEKEEWSRGYIRVTTTIVGADDMPVVALNRKAVYYSLRPIAGMVQFSEDWTA